VRPRRQQPTRLPRPWDSPGKNTGVGCHFLLQCRKVKSESEVTQSRPTLHDPMDCSLPGSSTHGILQARVLEWSATDYRVPNIGFTLCYPVPLGDFVKSLCFQYFKGTMDTIRVIFKCMFRTTFLRTCIFFTGFSKCNMTPPPQKKRLRATPFKTEHVSQISRPWMSFRWLICWK